MPINLNSFVWPSMGIEPPQPEDAIYSAGEQPIAGFDNRAMWMVTDDLHRLRNWAGAHGQVHEAGGGQEINLNGLSVGNVAKLIARDADGEFQITATDDVPFLTVDTDTDTITEVPLFGTRTRHREGIDLRSNIVRGDGAVVYDHADDYFHRARAADEAAHADEATNSQKLQGLGPGAFLQDDVAATITVPWAFEQTIDGDISGNAATADHADVADHATTADHATEADDSVLHEGYTVDEILEKVDNDLLPGVAVDVADDGTELLTDTGLLDFGKSIDVRISGDTAKMSVSSVPHAQEAEFAKNADKVDGYHAQELMDEVEQDLAHLPVDVADSGTTVVADADSISFDKSVDVSQKAPGVAGVSVDSVPHADTAEYAKNADKVDNMHAQEIIDAAVSQGGGADGRWTYIDDWQVGGENSAVDWEVDLNSQYGNTYDIYKMVLVHENYSSYEGWKWFKFNLNFDFRFRYNFSSKVRTSTSTNDWNISFRSESHTSVDFSHSLKFKNNWKFWPLCPTKSGQRAVAEYKIASPTPMSDQVEQKPHISVEHYNGDPDADEVLQHGKIDTDFSDVDALSLETDHPAQSYIQLWGTSLNIV